MKQIQTEIRKVRNTETSPKFEYNFWMGLQDSKDIEIFGGKRESFVSDGETIHKVSWSSNDTGRIDSTVNLLKKYIYYLTDSPYESWMWDNTEEAFGFYYEENKDWIGVDINENIHLKIKYFEINQVLISNNISSEYDDICEKLEEIYSNFDSQSKLSIGALMVMKVYLAERILEVLQKYGSLSVTYDIWELSEIIAGDSDKNFINKKQKE